MIVMAFDSVASIATVAVCDGEKMLAQYTINNGMTHSELLLPMAEDMLRSLGMSFDDIDMYAVSSGPGSFTGLRIGLSLVKGLAFGKDKPCVGVSSLEALAMGLRGLDGLIVPCMDARRGQGYTALFRGEGGEIVRLSEDEPISYTELARKISLLGEGRIYLCGDGHSYMKKALAEVRITPLTTPALLLGHNAYSVAQLALANYERGEYTTDKELAATYLRVPQAERERLERLNLNNN